jgi:hypothetical protein
MNINEVKLNIEAAAELIKSFNTDHIRIIEAKEINNELIENDYLYNSFKDIKDDLIKNNIGIYYNPIIGVRGISYYPNLSKYMCELEDWAESEYKKLMDEAIVNPDLYAQVFFKSLLELKECKYSYDEESYTLHTRYKGEGAYHRIDITLYQFKNLVNVNILEVSGKKSSYIIVDDNGKEKYLSVWKTAYESEHADIILNSVKNGLTAEELMSDEIIF